MSRRDEREGEQNRKIFIGGLSFDTTEETLKTYFGTFGQVVDCVVMKDPYSKRSRGFGFVTFKEADSVDAVQKKRPHTIEAKEVESKRAVPRENNTPEAHSSTKKIFLGGIKESVEEADVKDYFAQFGAVESVEMKTDRETGKKRGFCFVSFDDFDCVDKVVLMKNHTIKGCRCEAKKALARSDMMAGGGYDQYGGGGMARGPFGGPGAPRNMAIPQGYGRGSYGVRGRGGVQSINAGGYGDYDDYLMPGYSMGGGYGAAYAGGQQMGGHYAAMGNMSGYFSNPGGRGGGGAGMYPAGGQGGYPAYGANYGTVGGRGGGGRYANY